MFRLPGPKVLHKQIRTLQCDIEQRALARRLIVSYGSFVQVTELYSS